jgi:hypothetical protein
MGNMNTYRFFKGDAAEVATFLASLPSGTSVRMDAPSESKATWQHVGYARHFPAQSLVVLEARV